MLQGFAETCEKPLPPFAVALIFLQKNTNHTHEILANIGDCHTMTTNMNEHCRCAWEEMRTQRMCQMRVGYDPEFRSKLAEDHSDAAKYNNYEYGRRAVEALDAILDENSRVLEIGAGPGTLTIPLSMSVEKVVVIESSDVAVRSLRRNLTDCGIENVEITGSNWLDVGEHELGGDFDLVVCSHFLWQMKDLKRHLAKMEEASRGYCAVVQPAGRDDMVKGIYTEVTGERYSGEFDPDADYFAYLILRRWGRLVNVRVMNYSMERSFEQEVRYAASFIGKYVKVDSRMKDEIEQYISLKGISPEQQSAVVLWWERPV
uniref:Ribosomal RNA small subunit methyltransferase A n=1 Tax=Candidatus Methanogaster sp. ANME-2c ERB4 TaxID=2759911 RepID=A0A7G9YFD8_9EURY|nr:ribosomal RNA small subunit methyltransferase A [Methanosarcinales archaeon ANME-2c ERB4]